jgi:hypothetical protein
MLHRHFAVVALILSRVSQILHSDSSSSSCSETNDDLPCIKELFVPVDVPVDVHVDVPVDDPVDVAVATSGH